MSHTTDLIVELTKNIKPDRQAGSSNHWDMVRLDIRNKILNSNIENFLSWHNVVETMVVNSKSVAEYEYAELQKSPRWNVYKELLKDLHAGNPIPSTVVPFTNNNALHQMYHLHMYESKFGSILNSKQIVEFGGGYGCLCSLIKKMGFNGNYTIVDFPEFHMLQMYYLKTLGINGFTQRVVPRPYELDDSTFFAFWSLSETEPAFKQEFVNTNFKYLKNFLMTYQTTYESFDNTQFFNNLKNNSNFNCSETHLEHIPSNFYLFGERK
jgi:hypothetical protein